jgi:hypothetical protein
MRRTRVRPLKAAGGGEAACTASAGADMMRRARV